MDWFLSRKEIYMGCMQVEPIRVAGYKVDTKFAKS
jgi:hypothetical protein